LRRTRQKKRLASRWPKLQKNSAWLLTYRRLRKDAFSVIAFPWVVVLLVLLLVSGPLFSALVSVAAKAWGGVFSRLECRRAWSFS
jgi:hypothetical protein